MGGIEEFKLAGFLEFVDRNAGEDVSALRLKYHSSQLGFDVNNAILQIESRQKGRKKLPKFIADGCMVADTLSVEQATDEDVAFLHTEIASRLISRRKEIRVLVDLTAGLGIDFMAMASIPQIAEALAVELIPQKAEVLEYNCNVRKLEKGKILNADCISVLDDIPLHSIVMIDPARRGENNKRLYGLHDCMPDVVEIYKKILERGDVLMVKCSPMIDINQTLRDIPEVSEIYVISKRGECKEILTVIEQSALKEGIEKRKIVAVDIDAAGEAHEFKYFILPDILPGSAGQRECPMLEKDSQIEVGMWLYQPSSSVMKLSAWGELTRRYRTLTKVSENTNLFVSEDYYPDFPGRVVKIKEILDKRGIKLLKGKSANIVCRNYPEGVSALKKRLKITEGDGDYLYAFSGIKNKIIAIAAKKK